MSNLPETATDYRQRVFDFNRQLGLEVHEFSQEACRTLMEAGGVTTDPWLYLATMDPQGLHEQGSGHPIFDLTKVLDLAEPPVPMAQIREGRVVNLSMLLPNPEDAVAAAIEDSAPTESAKPYRFSVKPSYANLRVGALSDRSGKLTVRLDTPIPIDLSQTLVSETYSFHNGNHRSMIDELVIGYEGVVMACESHAGMTPILARFMDKYHG